MLLSISILRNKMIINYILQFAKDLILMILSLGGLLEFDIPQVIYDKFSLVMGYWNSFMIDFPFMHDVWICFLSIIAFEVGLYILKFFLGSRSPGTA